MLVLFETPAAMRSSRWVLSVVELSHKMIPLFQVLDESKLEKIASICKEFATAKQAQEK